MNERSPSVPPAVSVVICSHNPRPAYLNRTLAALEAQTLLRSRWELLLVDNLSVEPLALRFNLDWHPHGRHLIEPKLGLTPARLCGIAAARGGLIVFVDDDNLLAADYLERALRIGSEKPFLGAWGGCIAPEFEVEPPEWMRPHLAGLALREFPRDMWSNVVNQHLCVPCGAGLCVRREVAQEYARLLRDDPKRAALDRRGQSLMSAGDSDLAYVACDLGLGMGLFPELRMFHLIPKERLDPAYLIRLNESFGYSEVYLHSFRDAVKPRRRLSRWADYVRTGLYKPFFRKLNWAFLRGKHRALRELSEAAPPR